MTKNLSVEVIRKYEYILSKLQELYNNGILPRELKPMIRKWSDKLGKDELKVDERAKIDLWLKEGLMLEEQESRMNKSYVR